MQSTKRLEIFKASLQRKEALFDQRLGGHIDDVKSANGQPLNDKRNGSATTSRWDRQNDSLRNLKDGIEKTKRAIEREENKIADVEGTPIHDVLKKMVEGGELNQWRKHPNPFVVPGVERGRIVWDDKRKILGHRYLSEVPKDQYAMFRDAFNKASAAIRDELVSKQQN